MTAGTLVSPAPAPPAAFASLFPSELLLRLVQHFQEYGQLRVDGAALSARLLATGRAYDLPAAKAIETRLSAWAASAGELLADARHSPEADRLAPLLAEFREKWLTALSALQIPVERAAAIAERIAREGLTATTTIEDILRERLQHRP